MDVVKPYKGRNNALWAIHDMDITDKHWYLIPSLEMSAIHSVRVEDESGKENTLPLWVVSPGFPTTYKYFDYGNLKITDNGETALLINFSRGLPFEGPPVVPTVIQFAELVSGVLEGFRTLFQ